VATIKSLITAAVVVGLDEATLRAGEAGSKKYVLSASMDWASFYHLGRRDVDSFAAAGVLPSFAGIAVHDRYANYSNPRWQHLAGPQACAALARRCNARVGKSDLTVRRRVGSALPRCQMGPPCQSRRTIEARTRRRRL
jgi:hypothetical protein